MCCVINIVYVEKGKGVGFKKKMFIYWFGKKSLNFFCSRIYSVDLKLF